MFLVSKETLELEISSGHFFPSKASFFFSYVIKVISVAIFHGNQNQQQENQSFRGCFPVWFGVDFDNLLYA